MRLLFASFTAVVLTALMPSVHPAAAAVATFNFNTLPAFTTDTPFTDKRNGVTAKFTSPNGLFEVTPIPPGYSLLSTGNVLLDHLSQHELDISFSASLSGISFLFALNDPTASILLSTDAGGSASASGIKYPGFPYSEGSLSFTGAPFTEVTLTATAPIFTDTTPAFAVDNITVSTSQGHKSAALSLAAVAPTPEPSSLLLMAAELIILLTARCLIARG